MSRSLQTNAGSSLSTVLKLLEHSSFMCKMGGIRVTVGDVQRVLP